MLITLHITDDKVHEHRGIGRARCWIGDIGRARQPLTRVNGGIKMTPMMASGLADHVWSVEEILEKKSPDHLLQSN